jgi:hypothetical protein
MIIKYYLFTYFFCIIDVDDTTKQKRLDVEGNR